MTTKAELEKIKNREDKIDRVLFKCMEIINRMPEKWSIDLEGNIIIVYPHPVLNFEGTKVKGIKYLPHKSYRLPDVILDRYIYWEELLEELSKNKATKKVKKDNRGRKPKFSVDEVKQWLELREQGVKVKDIAKQVGANPSTVSKYIKNYKEAM